MYYIYFLSFCNYDHNSFIFMFFFFLLCWLLVTSTLRSDLRDTEAVHKLSVCEKYQREKYILSVFFFLVCFYIKNERRKKNVNAVVDKVITK